MISRTLRAISVPTITKAPPVAQGGILAKIGAKKTETKKASPVVIAVIPVLPPSAHAGSSIRIVHHKIRLNDDPPAIPVALSTKAVTGLVPMSEPIEIQNASTQYATVLRSKSIVTGSRKSANLAIE